LTALDTFPSFWWDEGWILDAARNLAEHGYYGQTLQGQPAPPGQAAAFPTVFSIWLAFQTIGIGLWQARFVIVLFMLGTFATLYALGAGLYNPRVGLLTILAALIFFPHLEIHPLYFGHKSLPKCQCCFFSYSVISLHGVH